MLFRGPSEKVIDQSICREQKTRLQCLAGGMPEFVVMPSAGKNDKVYKEKNRKNLAMLVKTLRLKRFCFFSESFSSNVKKQ